MTQEAEHKKRILDVARNLFQQYGIRSISMDDIAYNLGMSKKTIYQHFTDKDQIVMLATQESINEKKVALEEITSTSANAVDVLVRVYQFLSLDVRQTTSQLINELKKYHVQAWKVVQHFKSNVVARVINTNLTEGVKQGYFREDIDPGIITRVQMEDISLIYNEEIFPHDQYEQAKVSRCILDHFMMGISTAKGRKWYSRYKVTSGNTS